MRKKKKDKTKRRASLAGWLLIYAIIIGAMWAIDSVIRSVNKPESESEGIIADGEFYGSSSGKKTLEKETGSGNSRTPAPTEAQGSDSTHIAGFGDNVPPGCVTVPQEKKNIANGCLLLLDSEHPFTGVSGDFVTFDEKNSSYRMKNMDLTVKSEVVAAMNKMASAYETVTGRADLMVYSTTGVYQREGTLYPDELPDRATGCCIDLCILNDDGTISKIQEEHAWLTANAYLYGFVFSYTDAESDVNGFAGAPYHLRYVGKEHAGIMHEQGLTLREYLNAVKNHPIEAPFYYVDGGTTWSVYYVPAEAGKTEVPVPLNASYEISGNNVDGFIVKAEGLLGN